MQKFDVSTMKFVFDVVQTMIMVGISIYVWIVTNHKTNGKKITALEVKHDGEIGDLQNRLTSIETKIDLMPDKRSMHNLHSRMNDQAGILHKIEGELKGIGDNNALILQTLIKP